MKKNIDYVILNNLELDKGIKNKIEGQIKALEKNFNVNLISSDKKNKINRFLNIFKKSFHSKSDIIYLRNNFLLTLFYAFFFKKKIKLIEIPTPIDNFLFEIKRSESNKIIKFIKIFLYKRIYTKLLKKFNFIIEYENDSYLKDFINVLYIKNGINIDLKINTIKQKDNNSIKLISIANNSIWHGYDRVIKGLYNYYKKFPDKKVYYSCIGSGVELYNLKNLSKELNMEKYVTFYGIKSGKDLDKIVNNSDIAIGSLGMHRINLEKASTLKLREYCARGIPFVYAYNDEDFIDFKYSLKIESNEKPININKIIEFYNSIKNENYIEKMRKYAEENLTWNAKMKPVIEKITKLIEERNFDK